MVKTGKDSAKLAPENQVTGHHEEENMEIIIEVGFLNGYHCAVVFLLRGKVCGQPVVNDAVCRYNGGVYEKIHQ